MSKLKMFGAFVFAVVVTTASGSVLQTQFNLAALSALDVPLPLALRLQATWHDLLNFTPAWGLIVLLGFVIALPVAGLLRRWWPVSRAPWYALAGLLAIATALLLMALLLPVAGIAATRSLGGQLALVFCGALGGWSYALMYRPSRSLP